LVEQMLEHIKNGKASPITKPDDIKPEIREKKAEVIKEAGFSCNKTGFQKRFGA